MAESYELLDEVATQLLEILQPFDAEFYFKASFDKANRSSAKGERGPGLEKGMEWFQVLKEKLNIKILTDIHRPEQAGPVADVCDGLQIPAFLCRQTDLVVAAAQTGRWINVKKGQFLAPHAAENIIDKVKRVTPGPLRLSLTERGSSFGYGDLVVDMRGLKWMADLDPEVSVIFDVTHSTQSPAAFSGEATTSGKRGVAPLLLRAAVATGYTSGIFLEVHRDPGSAKSDADCQVNLRQARVLIEQAFRIREQAEELLAADELF